MWLCLTRELSTQEDDRGVINLDPVILKVTIICIFSDCPEIICMTRKPHCPPNDVRATLRVPSCLTEREGSDSQDWREIGRCKPWPCFDLSLPTDEACALECVDLLRHDPCAAPLFNPCCCHSLLLRNLRGLDGETSLGVAPQMTHLQVSLRVIVLLSSLFFFFLIFCQHRVQHSAWYKQISLWYSMA